MIYFVRYKTLNRDLENAIGCRALPIDQLIEISGKLKEEYKAKRCKAWILISIFTLVLAAFFACLMVSMFKSMDDPNFISNIILFIGTFVVLSLIAGDLFYKVIVGKVKGQFNRAVKNGYPELYKQVKL